MQDTDDYIYVGQFRQEPGTFWGYAGSKTWHGRGVCSWKDGQKYEGMWKDGWRNGQGVYTWPGGTRYEGEFKDGRLAGKGVFTWPDGRRYEGEFKDDKKAGKGVLTWPGGDWYEGEFEDDHRSGKGVLTGPNGWRYEGGWKNSTMTGQGVLTLPDGGRYEGEFNDNHRSGNGVLWLSGGRVFDGVWAESFPQHGTAMEPGGALFRAKFDGKSFLSQAWYAAERVPAGRVASGGPPPHGGTGGTPPEWRGRAELLGGVVVDGVFRGLRPHGSATLEAGGVTYAAEYDGARTIAEEPVPVRKQVPPRNFLPTGSDRCMKNCWVYGKKFKNWYYSKSNSF